ncbi:hypothetical protein [Dehalobacterium formicoaceticum]|uniref:Uncharacterized protein n=1 Tax=Dehalobacterium formicoaceticum TaxID=51515 RepID=A0ABT1Y179_9FIRM|nr:hypothetical protein [Dehalobacterium formicoaceticum]MCR6544328.1 hypothetical protein [Dehalobacterium formicoaceticum]
MEQYFEKMQEYLKMETEISYEEFAAYYADFMEYLNKNYGDMDQETLLKGRFICLILEANSQERSRRKSPEAKKFRKMMEKSNFWAGAIKHRLLNEGMTAGEIDEAQEALHRAE